jgi:hypothetical protein
MATDQENTRGEPSYVPIEIVKIRERRDRRIAEIHARKREIKVEPNPGLKELVDTQDEFRKRIKEITRRIARG